MDYKVKSPISFTIFRRPEATRQVFEIIRKVRPDKLFVNADGPRNEEEKILTEKTRAIIDEVDWDCQVYKNYSETNLGATWRPYTGISWVFEQIDEAILLEDDNLPSISFFRFCDEMLERYRTDSRVFSINGANFYKPDAPDKYSYWFSSIAGIWGWATWKRSWQKIDMKMEKWPQLRETNWIYSIIPDRQIAEMYKGKLDRVYYDPRKEKIGFGYAYLYSMMLAGGLDIRPEKNLVSNIGFGPGATNTTKIEVWADVPAEELSWPLRHPPEIKSEVERDIYAYRRMDPNINHLKYTLKKIPFLGRIFVWIKKGAASLSRIWSRVVKSARINSDYRFSLRDYFIYIFEELAHKKMRIEDLGGDKSHDHLRIQDFEFYWPRKQPRKELSALWQEVFNTPVLDPHSYEFPEGLIKNGDVAIDAGACEGFFTHYALGRGTRVLAFEPLPILKQGLEKTFASEIAAGKVKLFANLLGAESRMSGITSDPEMLCLSAEDENGEKCEMTSFDDWMEKNQIDKVDFIKMDIEGAEIDAFRGAEKLIRRFKPRLAIAVYHEYENANLVRDLILKYRPDYKIRFSGIWDYQNVKPRPYMIYAY